MKLLILSKLITSQVHGHENGHHEHSRIHQSQWNEHVHERPSSKYSKEGNERKEEENLLGQTRTDSGTGKPGIAQEIPPIEVKHAETTTWISIRGKDLGFLIFILLFFIFMFKTEKIKPDAARLSVLNHSGLGMKKITTDSMDQGKHRILELVNQL